MGIPLAFEQLKSLHSQLGLAGGGMSKTQALRIKLSSEARSLQNRARAQLATLGVYKHHRQKYNFSRSNLESWQEALKRVEAHSSLVEMDRLWWPLRESIDEYVATSEDALVSYQEVFNALDSYHDCSMGQRSLAAIYGRSMKAGKAAKSQLQASWRKTTQLFGELAAII